MNPLFQTNKIHIFKNNLLFQIKMLYQEQKICKFGFKLFLKKKHLYFFQKLEL